MAQQKPIHEIRLGHIRAAIWPNETEGRIWYGVSIVRRYRNGQEWKDTTSFNRDDLPVVAQIAQMAFAWIWEHPSTESNAQEVGE